jgi:dynein intermediate chain
MADASEDLKRELEAKKKKLEEIRRQKQLRAQSAAPVASPTAADSSLNPTTPTASVSPTATSAAPPAAAPSTSTTSSAAAPLDAAPRSSQPGSKSSHALSLVDAFTLIDLAPTHHISYEQSAQTDPHLAQVVEVEREEEDVTPLSSASMKVAEPAAVQKEEKQAEAEWIEMDETERSAVESTHEYRDFLDKCVRLMDRVMKTGIFVDYGAEVGAKEVVSNTLLAPTDRHASQGEHPVTAIDWSPIHPELYAVATYSHTVSLYSLLSTMPERVLTCPLDSPIARVHFSRHHSHLVFGGTYSGHIIVWDIRTNTAIPSFKGHSNAIVGLMETNNGQAIVSVSCDGQVCTWHHLESLSAPHESSILTFYPSTQSVQKILAPSSIAFCDIDAKRGFGSMLVGNEDGSVYTVKKRSDVEFVAAAHEYPITAVCPHPVLRHVFATSSIDWTLKVWSRGKMALSLDGYFQDYVYDAAWCPVHSHPGLLATVDGTGKLALWDLTLPSNRSLCAAELDMGRALCRLAWSEDGMRITVGDASGKICVVKVDLEAAGGRDVSVLESRWNASTA